jgi:hypothetical protein
LPCPGAVRPPGNSAAMRHARRHACSGEPPGRVATPVDAARCSERVGAHYATGGLAAGELRPAELLPCLCATGQWGLGTQRQWLEPGLGARCRAHTTFQIRTFKKRFRNVFLKMFKCFKNSYLG